MTCRKPIAAVMLLSSATVAAGAAMEFVYFGPGTDQFLAGAIAAPAGVLGWPAAWRCGGTAYEPSDS